MTATEEITATFLEERIRFANSGQPDIVIGTARLDGEVVTVKGPEDEEFVSELPYRFFGKWQTYRNKRTGAQENQFHFVSCVRAAPHTAEAMVVYLAKAGEGLGLGRVRAHKLVSQFGSEAIQICRQNPDRAADSIKGWNREQAGQLAARLLEMKAIEGATMDLFELFDRRGFPRDLPSRLLKTYGNKAHSIVVSDPYCLLQFSGCGFLKCDKLYLQLDHDPTAIRRQALCGWYAIASNTEGHTWHDAQTIAKLIVDTIGPIHAKPFDALIEARNMGLISVIRTDDAGQLVQVSGIPWLAESRKAEHESIIADSVKASFRPGTIATRRFETIEVKIIRARNTIRCHRCGRLLTAETVHLLNDAPYGPDCITKVDGGIDAAVVDAATWLGTAEGNSVIATKTIQVHGEQPITSNWPDAIGVTDHQAQQLRLATRQHIGCFGGAPGTGKTFTAAALIKAIVDKHGAKSVAVASPTGKAAVRITEALIGYGVDIRARTIHSLLGVGVEGGEYSFAHDEDFPLPYDYIVVDEASMLDTSLCASLMRARASGSHILFVGDINQLPPVGHGSPLRDMIMAGIPYGELRDIHRNSGGIVEACAAIRDGQNWQKGTNLSHFETRDPAKQIDQLLVQCRMAGQAGFDPVWDCQIIVPVNAKSPLSRQKLNPILQQNLNLNPEIEGSPFRIGDKVVNTKNSWLKVEASDVGKLANNPNVSLTADGSIYVANGEQGRVIAIEPKRIRVQLVTTEAAVWVPRGRQTSDDDNETASTGCQFDLAYAISCHKSQGSEWPVVIVMLDGYGGSYMVTSREWLYTAISRAKNECHLIGSRLTADRMTTRVAIGYRKTLLKELILQGAPNV